MGKDKAKEEPKGTWIIGVHAREDSKVTVGWRQFEGTIMRGKYSDPVKFTALADTKNYIYFNKPKGADVSIAWRSQLDTKVYVNVYDPKDTTKTFLDAFPTITEFFKGIKLSNVETINKINIKREMMGDCIDC